MSPSQSSFITQVGEDAYIGIDYGDGIQRSAITAMRLSGSEFEVLYCATWENRCSEVESLAIEYYERCEAYDRTVCNGPIVKGEIHPATHRELRLINIYATKLRSELAERSAMLGFSATEFVEALRHYA